MIFLFHILTTKFIDVGSVKWKFSFNNFSLLDSYLWSSVISILLWQTFLVKYRITSFIFLINGTCRMHLSLSLKVTSYPKLLSKSRFCIACIWNHIKSRNCRKHGNWRPSLLSPSESKLIWVPHIHVCHWISYQCKLNMNLIISNLSSYKMLIWVIFTSNFLA